MTMPTMTIELQELKIENVMQKPEIFCANCKQQLNSENHLTQTENVSYELNPVFEINLNLDENQHEAEFRHDDEVIFLLPQRSRIIHVKDALDSVYKLVYLHTFTNSTYVVPDNDEPVGVCTRCADVLCNLYKFYDEFNELREIDSYLSKNLEKLDELLSRPATKEQTSQVDLVKFESQEVNGNVADIIVHDEINEDRIEESDIVITVHKRRRGRPPKKSKKFTTTTKERKLLNDQSSHGSQKTVEKDIASTTVISSSSSSDPLGPGPWIRISRLRPEDIPELSAAANTVVKEDVDEELLNHTEDCGVDWNSGEDNYAADASPGEKQPSDHDDDFRLGGNITSAAWNLRKRKANIRSARRIWKRKTSKRKKVDSDDEFQWGDNIFDVHRRKRKLLEEKKANKLKEETSKEEAKEDAEIRDANGRIPCAFCAKSFLRVYEMNRHLAKHRKERGNEIPSCQKCRRTFLKESDLAKHLKRHERTNYPFGTRRRILKPEELKQQQELEKQTKDSLVSRSIFDDDDDDFFNDLSSTKSNESSDKPNSSSRSVSQEKFVFCHLCNAPFKRKYDLKRHLERHEGENLFNCPDCPKTFVTKEELEKHSLKHMGGKPYKCGFPFCQKAFSDSYKVKTHMKLSHPKSRPYKCEKCGKIFPFAARLKRHELVVHAGFKPHLCQHCGKTFAVLGDMLQHAFIHTGEKPFTCEVCQATFARAAHLRRHSLIHTKIKSHLCPTCGFTCSLSTTLKRHFQTHTGEKPYKCHCGVSFPDKRPLVRHKILAHPECNQNLNNTSEGDSIIIESLVIGTPEDWLAANRNLTFAENPTHDFQQQ